MDEYGDLIDSDWETVTYYDDLAEWETSQVYLDAEWDD